MDSRDDWPDEILEGDLGAVSEVDPEERLSAARIARDSAAPRDQPRKPPQDLLPGSRPASRLDYP